MYFDGKAGHKWTSFKIIQNKCESCDSRVDCLLTEHCTRSTVSLQHPIGWNSFRGPISETYAIYYFPDYIETDLLASGVYPLGRSGKCRLLRKLEYSAYILDYPFDV